MNAIKILLLCSGRFAIPAMRDFVFAGQLAVVGIPVHCEELLEEVQQLLKGTGIPVLKLDKEAYVDQLSRIIKENGINLGFIMTFSYRLPPSLYNLPVNGFFNVHPGPLPAYRGSDPVFRQIRNRESHAGVTIHRLADRMDAGEIVIVEMMKLDPADTYGILNNKLAELATRLTGTLVKMAGLGIAIPSRPQDETKARYFKRQTSADITVNWEEMDAATIIALINSCNPWNKGAVSGLNNKIIRLLEAAESSAPGTGYLPRPGTIIAMEDDGISIALKDRTILQLKYVYIDEGYFPAGRLRQLGVVPGNCFTTL